LLDRIDIFSDVPRVDYEKLAATTTGEPSGAVRERVELRPVGVDELALRPGGRVPVDHIHARQEERFEVISGTARVRVGKTVRDLTAGESVAVPPGTVHRVWNETDEDVRVLVEFRPAMNTESLFEAICALARDGKVDRRGLPNPLRMAVVARALRDETYLAGIPIPVQRLGIAALAPLGRFLGYKARHPA
jgi:mannose-6-phosphate isomerase-like protein (cupin superfamily)